MGHWCVELRFKGVLSTACDISLRDFLRELEKGALFWEDAALQVHHLQDCLQVEEKGPLLWWGHTPASGHNMRHSRWNVSWILPLIVPTAEHLCGGHNWTTLHSSP